MSKRAYSAWDYPSNTKRNPIPPANSSQGHNRGVVIPQSQQSTAAKKGFPKPETAIPMDRQLYREALEAQTAASQNTAAKTPKQSVEKPLDRQNQENAKPADRKQKQMLPQEEQNILRQKQTVPQWKAKRPDGLRKSNGDYESEEERRQKELEEEERRREEAEEQRRWEELQEEIRKSQERMAAEEEFLEMQEKQIQNYQRYLDYQEKQWQQEKRRERWEGFGE